MLIPPPEYAHRTELVPISLSLSLYLLPVTPPGRDGLPQVCNVPSPVSLIPDILASSFVSATDRGNTTRACQS